MTSPTKNIIGPPDFLGFLLLLATFFTFLIVDGFAYMTYSIMAP